SERLETPAPARRLSAHGQQVSRRLARRLTSLLNHRCGPSRLRPRWLRSERSERLETPAPARRLSAHGHQVSRRLARRLTSLLNHRCGPSRLRPRWLRSERLEANLRAWAEPCPQPRKWTLCGSPFRASLRRALRLYPRVQGWVVLRRKHPDVG